MPASVNRQVAHRSGSVRSVTVEGCLLNWVCELLPTDRQQAAADSVRQSPIHLSGAIQDALELTMPYDMFCKRDIVRLDRSHQPWPAAYP